MSKREKNRKLIWYGMIYAAIAVVTSLHYLTGHEFHHYHGIYRRLYYLPIIFACFAGGLRGGMIAALVVCLLYLPHAAGIGSVMKDPGSPTEKALEIVLYVTVALVTGLLVSRGTRTRDRLRSTIAEKERVEAELVRSAKLAAVGRLSAGLAHEIRNPLASIKGAAELVGDNYPDDHPKRKLLDTMVSEANRLNGVLSRFLAFARPEPISGRDFDPIVELDSVVTLLATRIQESGAAVDLQKQASALPLLSGDPEQFRQVMLNIILNALEAAGDGAKINIRIEEQPANGEIAIHIDDNGPGFSGEAVENLFTPFFTTKEGGTGLGLAISHRIVESHGGKLDVTNLPDGGARVSIRLPAGQ